MSSLRFGTDGIRGVANTELTPEFALQLGRAAAKVLGGTKVLLGRDTRLSGPLLGHALAAGFMSAGVDVIDLSVVPTPAVAWASAHLGVPAAMISASHNPYADNGIKLFLAGGRKLPDAVEAAIEAEVSRLSGSGLSGLSSVVTGRAHGTSVGTTATPVWARTVDGRKRIADCSTSWPPAQV